VAVAPAHRKSPVQRARAPDRRAGGAVSAVVTGRQGLALPTMNHDVATVSAPLALGLPARRRPVMPR
jgi:hypothetical protein